MTIFLLLLKSLKSHFIGFIDNFSKYYNLLNT